MIRAPIQPRVDERPAWFDYKMLAYRPLIKKLARRHIKPSDMDDFVQDVIVYSLSRWHRYRPEQYHWATWIHMMVRNVLSKQREAANTNKRKHVAVALDDVPLSIAPAIDDSIDARRAMEFMPAGREGLILWRNLNGDLLKDIGRDIGISHERCRQLRNRAIERTRQSMRKRQIVRRMDGKKEAA